MRTAGIAALIAIAAWPAHARPDERWAVRAGASRLHFADKVDLTLGGAPYPGAALATPVHYTPTVQIGYFVRPKLALNATVGLPPKIDIDGGGTIQPLDRLGSVRYGSASFTLQYHPVTKGRVQPYLGAGLAYFTVLQTRDGSLQNLRIKDDLGPAVEAGVDLMIGRRWGLFAEVKRAWLRPQATGVFAGLPVAGKTRLDPWVASSGVVVRF